jgi:hypothetical protein
MIFVFGSNDAGIHGAGAAKVALDKHGAQYGKSYGHYGNSFAIPTKDIILDTLPIDRIHMYVLGFIAYATGHPKLDFQVTKIGCGLAGYTNGHIAPLFQGAPINCQFDIDWQPYMIQKHKYWGTK